MMGLIGSVGRAGDSESSDDRVDSGEPIEPLTKRSAMIDSIENDFDLDIISFFVFYSLLV